MAPANNNRASLNEVTGSNNFAPTVCIENFSTERAGINLQEKRLRRKPHKDAIAPMAPIRLHLQTCPNRFAWRLWRINVSPGKG